VTTQRLWRVHAPAAAAAALGAWSLAARAASDAAQSKPGSARVDVSRLPEPGSYSLARVMPAPDGEVLNTAAQPHRLHRLLRGSLSVVSFMYTYCRDAEACPRAWAAMETVQRELLADRPLAAASQLISLSFDPRNDTPAQMRLFGGERVADARVRWHFLTTASVPALLPLLRGFGQDVSVELDAKGQPTRTLNHMLKLFLVDTSLQVREIYSVATLDPRAILNDLRTLQAELART
jgi:protein SCO1